MFDNIEEGTETMSHLNLEMFIDAQRDYESSRFRILSGLQKIRKDFSQNKIYPPLAELIELYHTLRTISDRSDGIRREMPKRIKGIDMESQKIIYEWVELDKNEMRAIEELVHWSLPYIQEAIDEGQTIYNFVDECIKVEEVGILPSYVEEGYLLLPELRSGMVHVIRYEATIFSGPDQKYRNLKTSAIGTFPMSGLDFSPGRIKLDLMRTYRELPNPATYYFATDLDFPFNETMLPVAKRKLLRQISS